MYEAGFLKDRVTVLNRATATTGAWGRTAGDYEVTATYWANWKWTKGAQAMREGALDAYDTIMVRMRYHDTVTRDSRLRHDGKDYQITSLNASKDEDEMQIICVELQS